MRDQFISYELALVLKEKGFDELCLYQTGLKYSSFAQKYDRVDQLMGGPFGNDFRGKRNSDLVGQNKEPNKYKGWALIPLWQQVIDWFRVKHNIDINIIRNLLYPNQSWMAQVSHYRKDPLKEGFYRIEEQIYPNWDRGVDEAGSYEQCREKAIVKALSLI